MDPPAYSPATQRRSIHDLRSQIIANGSVIKPRSDTYKSALDYIELIVAKAPKQQRTTHFRDEKQAFKTSTDRPISASSGSASTSSGKHYALLVRRSSGSDINIIVQGEPKDTVEEALEWMLERTEMMIHDLVIKKGRPDNDGCCVI